MRDLTEGAFAELVAEFDIFDGNPWQRSKSDEVERMR